MRNILMKRIYKKISSGGVYPIRLVTNGSMTLETALILPVFLITIICFVNYMVIMNFQNIMQSSVNHTAKSIGRYTYVIKKMDGITGGNLDISGLSIDNDILVTGINTGYAWKKILTDEVKKYSDKVNVYGGINGISIISSKINEGNDGINDIRVNYRISMNIFGEAANIFGLSNRCYFHTWIGTSIDKRQAGVNKNYIVYITKTGNVYHLTDTCTHINISVSEAKYSDISSLRNEVGAKYKPCTKCVGENIKNNDTIYITANGTKYHCDSKCSKIKREVIQINLTEVGNRKLCDKCGKGK